MLDYVVPLRTGDMCAHLAELQIHSGVIRVSSSNVRVGKSPKFHVHTIIWWVQDIPEVCLIHSAVLCVVLLPFPIRTKEARERKRKKMGRGE
jgi:hypothetical protein